MTLQSIGSIQESSLQECIKAPQICALLVGKGVIVGKLLFVNFWGHIETEFHTSRLFNSNVYICEKKDLEFYIF